MADVKIFLESILINDFKKMFAQIATSTANVKTT